VRACEVLVVGLRKLFILHRSFRRASFFDRNA
jgi:hypothetical protein